MEQFLSVLLTMSLSAALVALVVMGIRFFFPKLPRALVCLLWLVVFFRMVCPASFQLPVSLLPQGIADGSAAQFVLDGKGAVFLPEELPEPDGETGDGTAAPSAGEPAAPVAQPEAGSSNGGGLVPAAPPLWPRVVFDIWAGGTLAALAWAGLCYRRFRRRTAEAVKVEGNCYESDLIPSPFVLGVFRPKIYLPVGLAPRERHYVLLHEEAHLRRKDNIAKPLAYVLLCFHWFNPVLWVAYRLLCLDIETACDQAVLRQLDRGETGSAADYAAALLHLSREAGIPSAVPLAFGEEDAKGRIAALLQYKRLAPGFLAAALALCLVVTVCLAADPTESVTPRLDWRTISQGAVICQGKAVPLPEELLGSLTAVLDDTKHGSYVLCEDPGLPEGTLVLTRDQGDLEYRLISSQVTHPQLVQVRHGKTGDTYRAAQLDGNLTHYRRNLQNTVYRRWVNWWVSADPHLPGPTADELYAMAPASGEDLTACAALLDQLGVRDELGPYTLSLQQEADGRATLVLALEQTSGDGVGRLWADRFLNSQGAIFLSLVPDLSFLAWYDSDTNAGARISRHSLLPYDEFHVFSLEEFRYLYPQRHLWWWHTLSTPVSTVFCPSMPVMFHPAYSVSNVIYPPAAYTYTDPRNEFFFVSDLGFVKIGSNSLSFTAVRAPLSDTTLPDPEDPSRDLLAGRTVLRAWYFHSEDVAGAPVPAPWSQRDTGYRLYETDDGPYLARWRSDGGTGWTLDYFLKLREKAISFDSSASYGFYDEYVDPFTESLDLYHQEGD